MIILSIDPNTYKSGWCIYDNGNIESGTIELSPHNKWKDVPLEIRAGEQRKRLIKIINGRKIDSIIYETFHVDSKRMNAGLMIAFLVGAMTADVSDNIHGIAPGTWRKKATGTGKKNDNLTLSTATEAINRAPDTIDEATAICIMLCAIYLYESTL